jgi:predicted dehydrogenase
MQPSSHRRSFLRQTSTGLGVVASLSSRASAASPNDKLTLGLIGCGGRGLQDAMRFKDVPNVELVYVCDCDEARRNAAAKTLGLQSNRAVADIRRLFDDKSLDAVLIATPDHWHAVAAIVACDAGKHVYVEKPISHNIREGRLLVEASSRNKVHVQHGTQCRSTQMMIDAIQFLHDGGIGDVLVAKCWNVQKRSSIGRGQDTDPPAGFNYDDWVGPATMIPYRSNRVHNRWTWWYHFGTGDMGNDGVHDIDYTRWGLGVETHPSRVVALGGKYYFEDDQEFPDTQQVTFEYSKAESSSRTKMLIYEQRLWSKNYPVNVDSGAEFYGTNGQLLLSRRGKVQCMDSNHKRMELPIATQPQDDAAHIRNFIDAIRLGKPLNASALEGHLSTSLCHLGNIAVRIGRSLEFDPTTEQIKNDDAANALIRREYRAHWATPKNVSKSG